MDETPETRYVAVGDADVAYKVAGEGPLDLLYFYGLGSHIDMLWDDPRSVRWLAGLSAFSRLITFDRRGTGASDAVPRSAIPTWEEWTEDVGAVLDEVDSDRAAVFAALDAGPIAMLFAAMHPERVRALVLANTTARYLVADGYPIGVSAAGVDAVVEAVRSLWGTPDFARIANPSLAHDAEVVRENTRRLRSSATPRTAAAQWRYILETLDVRPVLPLLQAPTLVLHTSGNPLFPIEHGRYLADHIAGAKFVEALGLGVGFDDRISTIILEEITEFLTGERRAVGFDRVLTTVLFTDMVGSTERVASLRDQGWLMLLDAHDRAVRAELRRFRGREINTTGDGFCASFDGPARAIRCAKAITEAARGLGAEVRAGLHTGECEVRGSELAGLAVHVAARVASLAEPSEVLVSHTVKDLVAGSGIEFVDRGEHELKGVPGGWKLFAAT
jgi:class 3 adenylate cyclase